MTKDEFSRQYTEQLPKVRAYIEARISQEDDAEDLTADVFTKAYDNLDSYRPERAAFSTWLYTIANNTVRDYLRRANVRGRYLVPTDEELLNEVPDALEDGEERLCRRELLDALALGLRRLPELQRQIVVLQFYDGVPQKEIADRLGLSYANARYLSHRAVKALQQGFRQQGFL